MHSLSSVIEHLSFADSKHLRQYANLSTLASVFTYLSNDVAVIQWMRSCHKNHITTRVITLLRVDVRSLIMSVSTMRFLVEIKFALNAKNPLFKGHMINRISHSWSFYMKFMKLAEGSFHKFHMK